MYNFSNDLYILLNKYLQNLKTLITKNVLHSNHLLIKANEYKTKINLENKKKLIIYHANRANSFLAITAKNNYSK